MSGRLVVVTGGSRGIGLATAQRFVAQGDRVVVTVRSDAPAGLDFVRCDVTKPEDVTAAFDEIESKHGSIDVLVANAGITKDGLLVRMSESAFSDVIDANLTGSWRVAKRAATTMFKQRSGRIIFVSSVAAYFGIAGQANYAASKAGLIGLARSMARELAPRGITVNVVAPGGVETDMTSQLTEAQRSAVVANTPLGRFATPDEVAAAITFLASPEAAYITGVVLPVDGGLAMGT
jgi:NAD(P)-dependent dehydrogenase (short-subunit alcohol dehydrogenase family)